MIKFVAKPENVGTRLDRFLAAQKINFSRSMWQKLCEKGEVTVNGEVEKPSYKLHESDLIQANAELNPSIPKIELPIIYEDNDCLVIDKPAGILTHSKGAFNPEPTVATFIADKLQDLAGDRAGIVHRLDRATSGVIICAKNPESLNWLQKQFSQRKVKKKYFAVVNGHLDPKEAVIDMPIERHPRTPKLFRVSSSGRAAITNYKVLKSGDLYDLVELKPQTGRTHQLRVHLKQLKHPIVGDILYGGPSADRLYLHAEQLELTLPSKQRKVFSVPMPDSFNQLSSHG